MLSALSIRNVVLIDKLDLDFKSGLSVLTGETGAGKSILLDSLGLILGGRADSGLIRQGADKLSVTATFEIGAENKGLNALFEEYDLDSPEDGTLEIKRSLTKEGKGKIFLNDQPISAKVLKEIGSFLVEVHGQYDNQGLLNPANHGDILDSFGGYEKELKAYKESFCEYKRIKKEREDTENSINQAKAEEEELRHWVKELEEIKPHKGEEEELSQKRLELMNAEKIIESLNLAYGALNGEQDIISALRRAQSAIERADRIVSGKYEGISALLEQTMINAEEAISEIEDASRNVSLNQSEQEGIEERLYKLRGLARKHQCSTDELEDKLGEMRQKLEQIEHGEEGLDKLKKQEAEQKKLCAQTAEELSKARKAAAQKLDALVMKELAPLKMEKAKFETKIEALGEDNWTEKGQDKVYFTVSTNPNSPQGPLNKIASGGELARFMLALKVNLAQSSEIGTMIFDEVDAGVGGATARAVGERLARLGKTVQVLVVTHSPQVAACGNQHYKVWKETQDNITTTSVKELTTAERQEEVARMLAGEHVTDEARAAAKVLMSA